MSDENKIRDVADAIKGVVTAVPIYQDVAQPALQELGKGLSTAAKTIHVALAPISALVWGYDKIKDFVTERLEEKLRNVPPENIKSPSPSVAGPTLEALRYAGHEPSLAEMYANLLATSMDSMTAQSAHPAFVEIIKQLSPDEAKLLDWMSKDRALPMIQVRSDSPGNGGVEVLKNFSLFGRDAKCQFPDMVPSYVTNINRLGLISLPESHYVNAALYEELRSHETVKFMEERLKAQGLGMKINNRCVQITPLGKQFIEACINLRK